MNDFPPDIRAPKEIEDAMNVAMGMVPLNVLLPIEVIEKLQHLAKENSITFVAYVRQVLTQHANRNS